jgi:tetratricopeptide (TPR) repeat protein
MSGLRRLILAGIGCVIATTSPLEARAQQQASPPYSLSDIEDLVKGGFRASGILARISTSCISFTLNSEAESRLRGAGADTVLLNGLRRTCNTAARQAVGNTAAMTNEQAFREHMQTGNAYNDSRRFAEAEAQFREALKRMENDPWSRNWALAAIGMSLNNQGKPADAEVLLRRAVYSDTSYRQARLLLAQSLRMQGRTAEAVEQESVVARQDAAERAAAQRTQEATERAAADSARKAKSESRKGWFYFVIVLAGAAALAMALVQAVDEAAACPSC